jgi:hypothetical protein
MDNTPPDPLEGLELSERQQVYLEAVRSGMSFCEASKHAGVDRSTGFRWRQEPTFKSLIKAAQAFSVDDLKAECHRRAMKGSDRLLEFLLVNRAPEEFQSVRKVELSGHLELSTMSDADLRAELAALAASGVIPTDPDNDVSDLL